MSEPPGFLGLERRIEPRDAGPLAAALAEQAAPARVEVAYPGTWLRDDVYAIHGHYSDLHTTVPTFERLVAGAMARWVVNLPEHGATADDYEAALSPIYAWMHALTQRSDHAAINGGAGRCARRRSARAMPPRWRRSTPSGSARSSATCPAPRCAAVGSAAWSRCCAGSGSRPGT
jgi:hypothetical protein